MRRGAPSNNLFLISREIDVQNLHLSKKGDKNNFSVLGESPNHRVHYRTITEMDDRKDLNGEGTKAQLEPQFVF